MKLQPTSWKTPTNATSETDPPTKGKMEKRNRSVMKKDQSRDFLSDNDLETIKDRIRKKHRSDTAKLLTAYGLLLVFFIWYVLTHKLFK